jgi:hypothetical protein
MEAESILIALAEVAIAIAGFSGIVVALQRRSEAWPSFDRRRFLLLLEISLSCVFFSLIPILLNLSGASESAVWRYTSGIWLLYILVSLGYKIPQLLRDPSVGGDDFSKAVAAISAATVLVNIAVQVANVGWLASAWPHVLTIMMGMLLSCVLFVRLLRGIMGPKVSA